MSYIKNRIWGCSCEYCQSGRLCPGMLSEMSIEEIHERVEKMRSEIKRLALEAIKKAALEAIKNTGEEL